MRRLTSLALLAVLATAVHAPAQTKTTVTPDPYALVQGWYRHFLEREPDPSGLAAWAEHLRGGKSPEWVLAQFLGSEEYYLRAGSAPEGFVRVLFLDVVGREPSAQELQQWVRRTRSEKRNDIAQAMLQGHPRAWQIPADVKDRDYLVHAREQVRQLAAEVEHLQEDIVAELGGQKERDLYGRADAILSDLRHFQRSLRADVKREHLYDDFEKMDHKLHELMDSIRALGKDYRSLQRAAARVQQADRDLHYALSWGDTSAERGKQVLQRQTQSLVAETQELQRTARYALADNRETARLNKGIDNLAEAAGHFQKSLDQQADLDHLQRDFAAVDRAWAQVAQEINQLPPLRGNNFLRTRAQRVDSVHEVLHNQLGLKGERPRVVIQFDRPK